VTGIRNGPPRKLGSNSGRGEGFISPLRDFPIAPKTLLISYSMLTAGLFFSEVQRPGRDTEHSHPPGAEVNYDPPPSRSDSFASYSFLYGFRIFPFQNKANYQIWCNRSSNNKEQKEIGHDKHQFSRFA